MQVTIIVDNNSQLDHETKYGRKKGVAIWIETGNQTLLFDASTSMMAAYNIALLGMQTDQLDAIVLGQTRWKDAKGLVSLLVSRRSPVLVYHPIGFFDGEGGAAAKQHWTKLGADFYSIGEPMELFRDLWVSDPLNMGSAMELYLRTANGLVVVEGSAGSGLEIRIGKALQLTGDSCLHGLVGESFEDVKHMNLDFVAASYACGVAMEKGTENAKACAYYPVFCGMKLEC